MDGTSGSRSPHALAAPMAVAVLVAAAVLPYLPSLDGYFLADDFGFIRIFHDRPLRDFLSLFTRDWSSGLWGHPLDEIRPVIALSYRLDSFLWGLRPLGYHLTSVAFHALSVVLVFLIARQVTGGRACLGLLAGLLFAFNPTHVESVAWVAARVDIMSATFYLASFYLFLLFRARGDGRWWALSLAAFALALFSKELTVTLPFVLLAYDLLCRRPRALYELWAHVPFFALLGGYFFIRHLAFESPAREQMLGINALGAFLSRQDYYLGELVPPLRALPAAMAWAAIGLVLAGAVAASWAYGAGQARHIVFFGPIWHLTVLSPTMVATLPESHRYLLLPSAGLAVLLAVAVAPLPSRAALAAAAAASALLVPLGMQLADYQGDWVRAGDLSRDFTRQVEETAREAPSGTIIVLGVPGAYGRAYLWAWALPFALQEPFTASDLYQDHVVLERPEIYRCPFCWGRDRAEALQAALGSRGDVHLIYLDGNGRATRKVVDGGEWQTMTEALRSVPGGPTADGFLRLLDALKAAPSRHD